MGRMVAVSYKPYRTHHLEMRDGGGTDCAVIIHPPHGRGEPQPVQRSPGQPVTLGALIAQAKAMIDVVMGPRPAPPPHRAYGGRRG
ncbi:hypothetical protein [Muricoccus radiodurans]|uniref:hypothetical protein n=1 Tax=Muricoccus radiodurans TaxID=2231721 RepID=UPI003CF03146